jgi:hypothetical protein
MSPELPDIPKKKLPNWEIAVYVVHLLDGVTRRVSTEDIALKCFELAPDAFSWVKHPEYPDKDVVRSALVDARKRKNGELLRGRTGRGKGQVSRANAEPASDGWMLTEAGAKWILENQPGLPMEIKCREKNAHRQERQQKISHIRKHPLFSRFLDQPERFSASLGDMAELFRCRVDADRATWNKRFQSASVLAQVLEDKQVLGFVEKCRESVQLQIDQ